MAQVDPFVHRIPSSFLRDPEARAYFEYLNQVIHDLWVRSGGSDDSLLEVESEASTTRSKVVALVSDLGSQLDDLRSEISTVRSLMNAAIAELKDMAGESEAKRKPNLAAIYEKLDELEARI
jgi:hypothetical protein